jgi:hypothetical protein
MIDIYLCGPYSHEDLSVIEDRHMEHCGAAWWLMNQGYTVFSPIAHSHAIGAISGRPTDNTIWLKQDLAVLPFCRMLVLLKLMGWERSAGTRAEIEYAKSLGTELKTMHCGTHDGLYFIESGLPSFD